MIKYNNIIEAIEFKLQYQKDENDKLFYKYCESQDEVKRLRNEVNALRNDLFELSKEHFKEDYNGKRS
jgi:hypothetical protein